LQQLHTEKDADQGEDCDHNPPCFLGHFRHLNGKGVTQTRAIFLSFKFFTTERVWET
jgi:hypothetical protein